MEKKLIGHIIFLAFLGLGLLVCLIMSIIAFGNNSVSRNTAKEHKNFNRYGDPVGWLIGFVMFTAMLCIQIVIFKALTS